MLKVFIFATLSAVLLGANPVVPQDPPLPDAVAFCQHTNEAADASYCSCPTAYDGQLCRSDEPLPNFCKKMCGHSRSCHCCNIKP